MGSKEFYYFMKGVGIGRQPFSRKARIYALKKVPKRYRKEFKQGLSEGSRYR